MGDKNGSGACRSRNAGWMDGCVCIVDDEERRGEADRLLEIDGLPRDVGRLAFELGSAGRDADYLLNTYPGGLPDFLNSY